MLQKDKSGYSLPGLSMDNPARDYAKEFMMRNNGQLGATNGSSMMGDKDFLNAMKGAGGPDLRDPNFLDLACALPVDRFAALISRDDLVCHNEMEIMHLIEEYRERQSVSLQHNLVEQLLTCVRFDKLDPDFI